MCAYSRPPHRQSPAGRRSGDGTSTSTVSACATDSRHSLHPRRDALAGNGAGHEHNLAVVPRQHAPAGHRPLDVERDRLSRCQHVDGGATDSGSRLRFARSRRSFERDDGQRVAIANQPIDTRRPRHGVGVGRHAVAKRRAARCRLPRRAPRAWRRRAASRTAASSARVERAEPIEEQPARLAAQALGRLTRGIELRHHRIDHVAERHPAAGPQEPSAARPPARDARPSDA